MITEGADASSLKACRSLQRHCTVCFMFEQCEGGRLGEDIEVMDGKKL